MRIGEVVGIDPDARTAEVVDAAGQRDTVRFAQPVLAPEGIGGMIG